MADYPIKQMEFEKMFSTDELCLKYLENIRFEGGYICPMCQSKEYWISKRNLYICKICEYQLSITAGTIFHKSKIPLTILFRALWFIVASKNGVSASAVQKILGVNRYDTVWNWMHKFRRLMVLPEREKLEGIIEVDETLIGGKKSGKRGRGAEGKKLVIIAVEIKDKKTGRVRLSSLPNASKKSINQFLKTNMEKGAKIITDGWSGYSDVKKMKYIHQIEENTIPFDNEYILLHVHKIASLLRRWLLGTHQNFTSHDKLDYYLDEFVFRYNRRNSKSRGLLFYTLIKNSMTHKHVSNIDITVSTN